MNLGSALNRLHIFWRGKESCILRPDMQLASRYFRSGKRDPCRCNATAQAYQINVFFGLSHFATEHSKKHRAPNRQQELVSWNHHLASLAVAAVAMLGCSNGKFYITQDVIVKQRLAS